MSTVERTPHSVLNEKAPIMIHCVDETDESRALCGHKYRGDEEVFEGDSSVDCDCVVCSELNRMWPLGGRDD
jgi:hypothetical protein